ncbi:MAG: TonB-dependent receptor [Cyanobacteria bacterium P01_G01_bin.19]
MSRADATQTSPPASSPATSVKQWNSQLKDADNAAAVINRIDLEQTLTGIEIFLTTAEDRKIEGFASTEGKNLIIDIPNARLELSEPSFIRQNPADGISAIVATAKPNGQRKSVQVIVFGIDEVPTARIMTTDRGLNISATASVPSGETAAPEQVIDIVVTAEKKPESIQDVPISITPFTEQEAEDGDITAFRDIADNTPNFTTYNTNSRNFVTYSIRGFSNFNFISRDSAAFYIDDVPYDYNNFLGIEVNDIERVEVLRGAQATLYGRNAQAGVVNIITKQPTDELEFSGSVGYGNFNNFQTQASVSSPIVEDKLSFRLSGSYESRDGFTENIFLDEDIDSQSGVTARGKLLWTPSDNLSVAFNASVDDYNDGAQPFVALDIEDPFEVEQDFDGFTNVNTDTQSVRVDYEHSAFRFTSISARRFSSSDFEADSDIFSPPTENLAIQVFDVDSDSLSQELRFQSPEQNNKFEWLLGSYLEFRDFDINESSFTTDAGITSTAAEVDEDTLAFFGQASYKPIAPLTLTAGLRYERFDSTLSNETISDFTGFEPTVTNFNDIEQDDDIILPRFVAQYRFSPSAMVYGSIARGYKPGGVNYFATTEDVLTFDTETSTNYEIGLKSSFLDNRIQLNLAGFYSPVSDFQLISFNSEILRSTVENADADIAGFEVELRASPFEGFEAIAGFGYVDATFDEFSDPNDNTQINGNNLPYVPDYTYNLALQYRFPQGIFARAELQGFGTAFFDNPNEYQQDAYALFNARIGYERDNYGIFFYADNIFDTEYLTTAFNFGSLGEIASFGAPATYGVRVRTKF